MLPTQQGSIRLFRFAGIQVYLHWSWFLIALVQIQRGQSLLWSALEYVTLFLIVLMHEFGHALACRSVGGSADQIVLWPLGGVAYVDPPQRPGATLWSIAAGPLVNIVLAPILTGLMYASRALGWAETMPNAFAFVHTIWLLNIGIIIFNLLPVYPLDGGQIVRSLLWFFMGRARSLMISASIGFIGVAALIGLALWMRSVWIGIMAVFILMNCWSGLQQARVLGRIDALARRTGFACPECHSPPPLGPYWGCGKCRAAFDTFETHGTCPNCGAQFPFTRCLDCGASHSISEWMAVGAPPVANR